MKKVLLALVVVVFITAGCAEVVTESAPIKVSSALVNGQDSICEIVTAGNDMRDFYGVYGATELERGTEFTFTMTYDDQIQTVPMIAKAGSIYVNEKLYGHYDGYVDDGTNTNFGFTSQDMPKIDKPHGAVNARVTLRGRPICEAFFEGAQ